MCIYYCGEVYTRALSSWSSSGFTYGLWKAVQAVAQLLSTGYNLLAKVCAVFELGYCYMSELYSCTYFAWVTFPSLTDAITWGCRYMDLLVKFPVLTKAVTSALLNLIGDVICQVLLLTALLHSQFLTGKVEVSNHVVLFVRFSSTVHIAMVYIV